MLRYIKKVVSLHSKSVGLVAQLDRVPDYGSGGCGFDSRPVHKRKSRNRFPFFVLCIFTDFLFNDIRPILVAPKALGIEAASFWSAAEKDTAESPTATAGTPKRIFLESPRKHFMKSTDKHESALIFFCSPRISRICICTEIF